MTDHDALRAAIAQDRAGRAAPISRLGFFCAPFRPASGPLADRVIKVYRGLKERARLERLADIHADYVALITGTGVAMPETEFHLLEIDGLITPVVVQDALPPETMMRNRMIEDDLETTLAHMQAAGEVTARFWSAVQGRSERIGFHPSIRNLAIVDGEAVFFDTFPPLIHLSRDEIGAMLSTFSDTPAMRLFAPFLGRKLTAVQDEWYSPAETLVGLVGSACRLRPDDAAAYLDWGRAFAKSHMGPWEAEILAQLDRPPKLSGLWMTMRNILGLQGAKNIR